jgi:hypothetical protein
LAKGSGASATSNAGPNAFANKTGNKCDAFVYFKHEERGIGPKRASQMTQMLARQDRQHSSGAASMAPIHDNFGRARSKITYSVRIHSVL